MSLARYSLPSCMTLEGTIAGGCHGKNGCIPTVHQFLRDDLEHHVGPLRTLTPKLLGEVVEGRA